MKGNTPLENNIGKNSCPRRKQIFLEQDTRSTKPKKKKKIPLEYIKISILFCSLKLST